MYCLLCHEKIPRLRAWRTKSEFCSDEHAAQYKKQTLDRLLTDQNPSQKATPHAAALVDEEPEEHFEDEMSAQPVESAPEPGSGIQLPAAHSASDSEEDLDDDNYSLPSHLTDDIEESQDTVDELWRLAEEVDNSPSDGDSAIPDASRQSAEEALQALRMLADRAAAEPKGPRGADESDALKALESFERMETQSGDPDSLPSLEDDLMAELQEELAGSEDPADVLDLPEPAEASEWADALGSEESEAVSLEEDRSRAEVADSVEASGKIDADAEADADDDSPSILERLLEDASEEWTGKPKPSPKAVSEESDALDAMEDPLADFGDLPEPDFNFDEPAVEALDDDDPLAGLADLVDEDDEQEIDPLTELINAEASDRESSDDGQSDDSDFDQAVADELVQELSEEPLRDNVDLQELERNLKVVPFPTPDKKSPPNGNGGHSADIAAGADEAIEANPLPQPKEPGLAAAEQKPVRPTKPQRPGRTRTRFKPSMVMAGVEPAMQGNLQGDPCETWRDQAVESAWGEERAPAIHGFSVPAMQSRETAPDELSAIAPQREFQACLGISMTLCVPAEASDVESPALPDSPALSDQLQAAPSALCDSGGIAIRLGPEYRLYPNPASIEIAAYEGEGASSPALMQEWAADASEALAPSNLFYDSVPNEERFVEEDEWDTAEDGSDDPIYGVDLSNDFESEQPATQSSGGRGR